MEISEFVKRLKEQDKFYREGQIPLGIIVRKNRESEVKKAGVWRVEGKPLGEGVWSKIVEDGEYIHEIISIEDITCGFRFRKQDCNLSRSYKDFTLVYENILKKKNL